MSDKIFRIYNSKGRDGKLRSPFWVSMAADQRLSSVKYGIEIGYWAPEVASCFLEVFLRRGKGEYRLQSVANIDRPTQARYHIAEYHLTDSLNLYTINQAITDNICTSAIYSNEPEKDEFVKDIFDKGYDGIEYSSNHHRDFVCYAIFSRAIKKLEVESTYSPKFNSNSLGKSPKALAEIIRRFEGMCDINFE